MKPGKRNAMPLTVLLSYIYYSKYSNKPKMSSPNRQKYNNKCLDNPFKFGVYLSLDPKNIFQKYTNENLKMEPAASFENPPKSQALGQLENGPFYKTIYDFLSQLSMASDLGSLIGCVVLFLIMWYIIIWLLRLVLSLFCAAVIVVLVVAIFRSEVASKDVVVMLHQATLVIAKMIAGTLVYALRKFSN
ncbi:uncharacterized protein LOC117188975 [Drosophila miranda]|uniref:uncharacterized protein LOC117188975 n=1 Tax=Drosophila miranda TaxID=7229 RepID=UPI00143FA7D2|nr:uncharacterized protein LOC117188975 [Drosophila miranda]